MMRGGKFQPNFLHLPQTRFTKMPHSLPSLTFAPEPLLERYSPTFHSSPLLSHPPSLPFIISYKLRPTAAGSVRGACEVTGVTKPEGCKSGSAPSFIMHVCSFVHILCVLGCLGASTCMNQAEYEANYADNYDNEISQDQQGGE